MAEWLTVDDDDLTTRWVDAPIEDPALVTLYLDAARDACETFAPDLAADAGGIPAGWRLAQAMQARNIWNAGNVAPGGDFTGEGGSYTVTAFPLDWQVQQLLRPRRVLGAIL
jgi:hypothetical protein